MTTFRFLSLEDSPLDAEVIRMTLTQGGIDYMLKRVETQAEFVAALETEPFDLILADYSLPGFDGIAALEIARNSCPEIPFIFVAGSLGEELAIEALKQGAVDYVLKQRLERLVPSVQRALREAKERRDRQRAEAALRDSEANLIAELVDSQRLQYISSQLIKEDNIELLYTQILDAAIALMHAEAGTIQIFDPEQDELYLLVWQGLDPEAAAFWAKVGTSSTSICRTALERGARMIIADVETCEWLMDTSDLKTYRATQIRAVQSTPLISRNGSIAGMISTHWAEPHQPLERELRLLDVLARQAADLIERKQAEVERERLLEREQFARTEAERANQIKDEFLAVLSHELRSPLNPILGWTSLLRTGNLNPHQQVEALATIERNAKLQVQLIDDLLDIARIMRGKLTLNAAPTTLSTVISAAVEAVQFTAEAKQIQMRLDLDPPIAPVLGDAARLQQVLWNLLTNAVKFTPPSGQVTVELRQFEQSAQIRVIDTGRGIRSEFLPYVFEYFRQEDASTTRRFGGLGLGLAIVRQIVELHGGIVRAESPGENQGATFIVQLPCMQQIPPCFRDADLPLDNPIAPLSNLEILMVDDEPDTRTFQSFVLEQSGAKVTATASGLEALQLLDQFIPDLLVSDIGMAEMDGYALIEQVRSRPPHQGGRIPAIALTAYAGELDQQRARQAGFQAHITKPVEPERLIQEIISLVDPN